MILALIITGTIVILGLGGAWVGNRITARHGLGASGATTKPGAEVPQPKRRVTESEALKALGWTRDIAKGWWEAGRMTDKQRAARVEPPEPDGEGKKQDAGAWLKARALIDEHEARRRWAEEGRAVARSDPRPIASELSRIATAIDNHKLYTGHLAQTERRDKERAAAAKALVDGALHVPGYTSGRIYLDEDKPARAGRRMVQWNSLEERDALLSDPEVAKAMGYGVAKEGTENDG